MNKKYQTTLKFYNEKSGEYAEKSGIVFHKFINLFISKVKNKKVLDIGCGPGHDTNYFFRNGINVIGVDASVSMIDLAKITYDKKIDFRVDDILDQSFFDRYIIKNVWISAVLMHFMKKDREYFLRMLNKSMEENGILGMILPKKTTEDSRKKNWLKFGGIFDTFSKKDIIEMIKKSNFEIIELKCFNFHKHPWWFVICKK
jgi:2-polyprenyl-3-methyl-5-hydroxy-6-metoxy-1,4-benzoquinol methylase